MNIVVHGVIIRFSLKRIFSASDHGPGSCLVTCFISFKFVYAGPVLFAVASVLIIALVVGLSVGLTQRHERRHELKPVGEVTSRFVEQEILE